MNITLREVVFDVEIVVGEGVVELRIEHFHQRRGRIAAKIHGHFIDFIEHENRIDGAGLAHHLDDLSRQRANIGAAMSANFSFIAHSAERHADKFAAGGVADGSGKRSLADARRPYEAEDGTLGIFDELANGEIFQDALLDFFQAVMIFVENLLGALDVANFLGALLPGHSQQPIEIVAGDSGFGRHGRHHFEPLQLLHGLFMPSLGMPEVSIFFLSWSISLVSPRPEFLLDGLELFVEVVLFLGALHLALHAGIDVAIDI